MKNYLNNKIDPADKNLISVLDELALWSAPFGLSLLNKIKMNKNMKVLDIGCGWGFPAIEAAVRLGDSSFVYGIDPWKEAIERAEFKVNFHGIKNIKFITGYAEKLPFEDSFFNLIISNNGINNVQNLPQTLKECRRVCKNGAQFVFTMNLEDTMIEFYNLLEKDLIKRNEDNAVKKMKDQIYLMRKPVTEIKLLLNKNGFNIESIDEEEFYLRFSDGTAMLNYPMIKNWFIPGWKNIIDEKLHEVIFDSIEDQLNLIAEKNGEIQLSVPYITAECTAN